jgi:hypothetical protein
MDVSKMIKEKNNWIFDDTFDAILNNKPIGLFVKAKAWKTNGGKDADVFVLAIDGTDYLIMPFKIDYLDFVENYGTDTTNWEGHQFILSKNIKGKYVMTSIEVKI